MKPHWTSKLYWTGIAVLTALWALLHQRILFGHQAFALLDASQFFFPYWKWGGEVLGQGTLPLWNGAVGFGTPYLADPQMAAWYPPRLIAYLLLRPVDAFNLLILAHHLWALVGFWTFTRHRGLGFWACLSGALVFGFSFTMISLIAITPMIFTVSWLPWIFLGVDKLWNGERGGFWVLACSMGMQLASGYPLHFYLTVLVMVMDLASRLFDLRILAKVKKWPWVTLGTIVAAIGLAVCANLAWLLPLREMTPMTNLEKRTDLWDANRLEFLKTWLNPFALGHPLHSRNPSVFAYSVYYVGLPPLVLFLWTLWRRKLSWVGLSIFLTVLVLSLGETAWLGNWLKMCLPGYRYVVRSGYWLPFVVWMMAMLISKTLEQVPSIRKKGWVVDPAWFFVTGGVFLTAWALGVPGELPSFWVSFLLILSVGFSVKALERWKSAIVVLAIVFSLGPLDRAINFSIGREFYEVAPAISRQLTKPGRLYCSLKTLDKNEVVAGDSTEGIHRKMKDNLIPNWPLGLGFEEAFGGNPIFLRSAFHWCFYPEALFPVTSSRALDYLGIRYAFGEKPLGLWIELKDASLTDQVWENPRALPKWFSVARVMPSLGEAKDWKRIGESSFDLKRMALVGDGAKAGLYSVRRVVETSRAADRVSIVAEGHGRAFLVSSETAYPGWTLEVEGHKRALEKVNLGFRGFVLEDREQDAVLIYRPSSFRLGCFFSLLTAGPLFLGILSLLRRKSDGGA